MRQALGGPGGRRAVIGRQGARPLIPARREGAGPAGCPAPGLRAPIDPAAAAPPLPSPQARGERSRSAEWRWGSGSSFRDRRRHLRVFGAGRRGCSGLQLERALLRGRSSPCSALPPPGAARPLRPPRAARAREGEGRGGAGAGRGRGTDTHPEESPRSQRPGTQGAPRPGPRSSRGRKGLRRGRGGGVAGAGLGVPALSCGARRLQVQFLLRRARSSLPAPLARPGSRGTRAFSGRRGHACPCRENFSCRLSRGGGGRKSGQRPVLCRLRAPYRVSVPSRRASLWGSFPGCSGVRLAGTTSPGGRQRRA